jgi:hypothetical protein
MPRPRRRQPDPARFPPCARCGQCYPGGAGRWPEGRVCKYCYLQARLRTGTCAGCGGQTSLPGLTAAGQPACTGCSGIPARFRCDCGVDLPVIHTEAEAPAPAPATRLAAIRRLLLDDTLALDNRIAGCLVVLYGQQVSTIASLHTADVSCTSDATRLRLGTDWLDVPEPVATLLRHHLRNRSNMTTAANPASPWLFPGQFAGEHRSYRRIVRILHQLEIPARASRLAAWRQLVHEAPPAVLADALGVSPDTAVRHALLSGADWSAYPARRRAPAPNGQDETPQ